MTNVLHENFLTNWKADLKYMSYTLITFYLKLKIQLAIDMPSCILHLPKLYCI